MKRERELTRELRRLGWRSRRGRGHEVWYCPCGRHIVTVSVSCSDVRAAHNTMSHVRQCRGAA